LRLSQLNVLQILDNKTPLPMILLKEYVPFKRRLITMISVILF
jgi:hypothetical protein